MCGALVTRLKCDFLGVIFFFFFQLNPVCNEALKCVTSIHGTSKSNMKVLLHEPDYLQVLFSTISKMKLEKYPQESHFRQERPPRGLEPSPAVTGWQLLNLTIHIKSSGKLVWNLILPLHGLEIMLDIIHIRQDLPENACDEGAQSLNVLFV